MVVVSTPKVGIYPWSLPQGWDWIALENLCSHFYGGGTPNRSKNEYFNGDIVWITPTDINANNPIQVVKTSRTKLTNNGLASSSAKVIPTGTVLFSSRATIGKIAIAGVPLCTNQGFANLVCSHALNNHYLAWCLRTLTNEIIKLASSTTYLEISRGNLRKFKIPIPYPNNPIRSLDIQRRIVARIETLIAEVKDSRSLLEEIRQDTQIIINLSLEEIAQSISLNRKNLLEVIESKPRNGWYPKCDDNPNGFPVLKLGAVLRFRYNPNEFKRTSEPVDWNAHYWLKSGDILISRSNTPELVGNASIYSGEPFPCIYPDLLMRIIVDQLKVDSRFLIYWLQTKEVRDYIKSHASGASSTMKKITQSDVCNIPFPKISLEEQIKLTSYLDTIKNEVDEMLKSLEQDAKLLDLLEKSILERAFRGEL